MSDLKSRAERYEHGLTLPQFLIIEKLNSRQDILHDETKAIMACICESIDKHRYTPLLEEDIHLFNLTVVRAQLAMPAGSYIRSSQILVTLAMMAGIA